MTSTTESNLRRESSDYGYKGGLGFDSCGSGGGPFTVFFRLVSADNSPGQRLQPITPLHTPFVQSPVQSPIQPHVPLYPLPSPTMTPAVAPNGVYYTTAPYVARAPVALATPPEGTLEASNMVKGRAMSADIHHSPPFHYVHAQPHRSSFCLPLDTGADLAMVSEEMLLSAMPDRYDD